MKKLLILLILLSLVPLLDLLKPGLPLTHDGQDHIARIANFYLNLSEGNIIPRWGQNLNWGYGHPVLMFLYPLPSYATSMFHFLGFSLIDSLKIVFGLTLILSGAFMFLWLREFLGYLPGFVGGLLYMFAPYRFVDLYVRGALGEHVAFVFLPLIFYFLLKLSKEKKFNPFTLIGGALSLAGLFLSHNAISVMFLPLAVLYSIFLISTVKKRIKLVSKYLGIFILGVGLSSFFLLPAFFEGKYTLRDIVTAKEYATRFSDISKFIYGEWNYGISGQFSVQVGLVHWMLVALSVPISFVLFKKKSKLLFLVCGAIIFFVATIFLMTPQSHFIWDKFTILQKFQFPWRFLSIIVFISSILGAIVINQLKDLRKLLTVIFIILILLINKDFWHAKGYLQKNESFFTGIYNGTTDTGESSPIWSVRFMENRPQGRIQVIDGNATINESFRSSTKHEYKINSLTETRIRENTLYFPGWEAFIDGKKTAIEFQDPQNRGLITFFIPKGVHKVSVIFGETNFRLGSDIISLVSISFLALIILWRNKQSRLF